MRKLFIQEYPFEQGYYNNTYEIVEVDGTSQTVIVENIRTKQEAIQLLLIMLNDV